MEHPCNLTDPWTRGVLYKVFRRVLQGALGLPSCPLTHVQHSSKGASGRGSWATRSCHELTATESTRECLHHLTIHTTQWVGHDGNSFNICLPVPWWTEVNGCGRIMWKRASLVLFCKLGAVVLKKLSEAVILAHLSCVSARRGTSVLEGILLTC